MKGVGPPCSGSVIRTADEEGEYLTPGLHVNVTLFPEAEKLRPTLNTFQSRAILSCFLCSVFLYGSLKC